MPLLHLSSLSLFIRLVSFEKYDFILLLLWWLFAFVLAFVMRGLYPGLGLVVVGLAFFAQKPFYRWMAKYRSGLIRPGDLVEFVEDREESYVQKFMSGKVLQKMRSEDVLKTGLFEEELLPLYSHFYLIALEDKNVIVPYEWIVSLDFKEEDLD